MGSGELRAGVSNWLVKNSKGKEKRKKMNNGFGEML